MLPSNFNFTCHCEDDEYLYTAEVVGGLVHISWQWKLTDDEVGDAATCFTVEEVEDYIRRGVWTIWTEPALG